MGKREGKTSEKQNKKEKKKINEKKEKEKIIKKEKKEKKVKKDKKDKNAPKKSLSAFFIFQKQRREPLKREQPRLNNKQLISQMANEWKELTEKEKAPYQKLADADKTRYAKEKKSYDKKSSNKSQSKKSKKKSQEEEEEEEEEEIPNEENGDLDINEDSCLS